MELPPRGPKESPCASHAPTRMQVRFGEGPRAAKPRNLCRRRRWARWGSGGVCSKGLHVRASVVTARAPAVSTCASVVIAHAPAVVSTHAPAVVSTCTSVVTAHAPAVITRAPASSPRMRQLSRRHRACASRCQHARQRRHRAPPRAAELDPHPPGALGRGPVCPAHPPSLS